MKKPIDYRIKEQYIGTTIWYKPQARFKFLWWTYWDNIANIYRYKHDAEHQIDCYIEMLENPAKSTSYNSQ